MPAPPNPASSWSEYFASTLDKPLHPIFARLDPHLPPSGRALELGCGVGLGAAHLRERGLDVLAVDAEPEAVARTRERVGDDPRVEVREAMMQDLPLGAAQFDAIVAGFSLFFLSPADFAAFWPRLVRSLKPGGLFAGQFLGVHDDWKDLGFSLHTRTEVERLLEPFDLLYFEEAERDGATTQGVRKHWHVFHVVGALV